MRRLARAFLLTGITLSAGASAPLAPAPRAPTRIRIRWEYRGIPAGMAIYEPAARNGPRVWEMGNGPALKVLPVGAPIADSTLLLRPGEDKVFVLVYHNTSDKPVEFFAAPHHLHPAEASLGFKFDCLCVNHVYRAEPGEYWWRVVQMGLEPDYEGETLEVAHALVRYKKRVRNPG